MQEFFCLEFFCLEAKEKKQSLSQSDWKRILMFQ